jgi:hypothetical protein
LREIGHWLRLGGLEDNLEQGTAGAQGRRCCIFVATAAVAVTACLCCTPVAAAAVAVTPVIADPRG